MGMRRAPCPYFCLLLGSASSRLESQSPLLKKLRRRRCWLREIAPPPKPNSFGVHTLNSKTNTKNNGRPTQIPCVRVFFFCTRDMSHKGVRLLQPIPTNLSLTTAKRLALARPLQGPKRSGSGERHPSESTTNSPPTRRRGWYSTSP